MELDLLQPKNIEPIVAGFSMEKHSSFSLFVRMNTSDELASFMAFLQENCTWNCTGLTMKMNSKHNKWHILLSSS